MTTEPPKKPGLLTMPWFKPLYRRAILIGIVAIWCGWEWLFTKDQFWGFITLAALGYAVWVFGINFDKELKKFEDAQPKN
ncbi:MAG: hypothetical protein ACO1OG_02555 [Devosia sp.]